MEASYTYEQVIRSNGHYVDKTLLIKELIDRNSGVYLITRPDGFGKSMNISMLQTFLEISNEDKTPLFSDKLIWQAGARYTSLLGQFPVIRIDLRNVHGNSWKECKRQIESLIQSEYRRHHELYDNSKLNAFEKNFFTKILIADENADWSISLKILSDMLYQVHGMKCIVLIDSYDTPIEAAYAGGFHDECSYFLNMFFSNVLKDNPSMELGYITGVFRFTNESIFSGLNNVKAYSQLDEEFSSCFGYTEDEVSAMASHYGKTFKIEEIRKLYGGYKFGNLEIYNPLFINSYLASDCISHTSVNKVIRKLLGNSADGIKQKLQILIEGERIKEIVNTNIAYPDMHKNPNAIFSYLLMTGYLTVSKKIRKGMTGDIVDLAIPNKAIMDAFISDTMESL